MSTANAHMKLVWTTVMGNFPPHSFQLVCCEG